MPVSMCLDHGMSRKTRVKRGWKVAGLLHRPRDTTLNTRTHAARTSSSLRMRCFRHRQSSNAGEQYLKCLGLARYEPSMFHWQIEKLYAELAADAVCCASGSSRRTLMAAVWCRDPVAWLRQFGAETLAHEGRLRARSIPVGLSGRGTARAHAPGRPMATALIPSKVDFCSQGGSDNKGLHGWCTADLPAS